MTKRKSRSSGSHRARGEEENNTTTTLTTTQPKSCAKEEEEGEGGGKKETIFDDDERKRKEEQRQPNHRSTKTMTKDSYSNQACQDQNVVFDANERKREAPTPTPLEDRRKGKGRKRLSSTYIHAFLSMGSISRPRQTPPLLPRRNEGGGKGTENHQQQQ